MKKNFKVLGLAVLACATIVACNNNAQPEEAIDTTVVEEVVVEEAPVVEEVVVEATEAQPQEETLKETVKNKIRRFLIPLKKL